MRCSEEVLATEAGFRAGSLIHPLVGFLYRLGCAIIRTVARPRGRSDSRLVACPPPPCSPPGTRNPSFPDDDPLDQHHQKLAQKLRPSLSPICDWLAQDDVEIVGGQPIRGGGSADIWRGSLDSRQVAIKSYRRYLSFDPSQVSLVGLPGLSPLSSYR